MGTHSSAPGFLAVVTAAALVMLMVEAPGLPWIRAQASEQVPPFSEWSNAVNLGPDVNSAFNDFLPELSGDGLSLYFTSNRPGGMGAADIWVSQRASPWAAWGEPVNLGAAINTAGVESAPSLSRDGHYLFFSSTRAGGFGDNDIWVAWRARTDDDLAWEPPTNLGPGVNSEAFEAGASLLRPEFYYTSTRTDGTNLDIFVSQVVGNSFGPARRVSELSSAHNDQRPSLRSDGLEIYFSSNRGSGNVSQNLWVATRAGRGLQWNPPEPLGPQINTDFFDQQPSISADGKSLLFSSNRPGGSGGLDLYMASRRLGQ